MEILEFLQDLRNPIWTRLNLLITNLGSEIIVVGVVFLLYWCINKKYAYRLGFVYFISGLAVQTLKIICKVPRPWIQSRTIHPVEEALGAATGYSFPSGHTQSATALYGTVAYNTKNRALQCAMLITILSVAFSRMYLGVHSPMDVSTALLLTLLLTIACNFVIDKKIVYQLRRETLAGILLLIPMAMLVYGIVQLNIGAVDAANALDYFKSAGAAVGFITGWYMEETYLNFDETRGNILQKAIRYVIGIALILGLRQGIKIVIGNGFAAGFIRYAVILFVSVYVYPLIFSKIGGKEHRI